MIVSRAQRSTKWCAASGIVASSEFGTIPDQRCTASRWMASGKRSMSPRRQDHRPAFAEADARITGLGAKAAEDDLVAVFDEAAFLAARQLKRLSAARGEFEETAPTRFVGARHRARSDQIADLEIAAIAGLVRDHLRDGPIHRGERGLGDAHRRGAVFAHGLG